MHYSEPYKLQLNLEISSSNMLEILKQLSRLTKDTDINTSFTLPEAIPTLLANIWKPMSYHSFTKLVFHHTSWGIST